MLPIVNPSYFPTVVLSSAGNRWRHECGLSAGTRWRYECVAAMTEFLVEAGAISYRFRIVAVVAVGQRSVEIEDSKEVCTLLHEAAYEYRSHTQASFVRDILVPKRPGIGKQDG